MFQFHHYQQLPLLLKCQLITGETPNSFTKHIARALGPNSSSKGREDHLKQHKCPSVTLLVATPGGM